MLIGFDVLDSGLVRYLFFFARVNCSRSVHDESGLLFFGFVKIVNPISIRRYAFTKYSWFKFSKSGKQLSLNRLRSNSLTRNEY